MCDAHRRLPPAGARGRGDLQLRRDLREIVQLPAPEQPNENPLITLVALISDLQQQEQVYLAAAKDSPLAKAYQEWQKSVLSYFAKALKVSATVAEVRAALMSNGFSLNTTLNFLK